jgi:2Fe-2S ferredoxin
MDALNEPGDQEMDQLDILPNAEFNSRLACQLRLHPDMDGLSVRLAADEDQE